MTSLKIPVEPPLDDAPGDTCVCGHPVSHHRTGERHQYNAYQSRCAYKATPTDAECPCQLHRDAASIKGQRHDTRLDDAQFCDGLHDEGAPERYLCSRCFPDFRGDLAAPRDDQDDDDYSEQHRDDAQKME